MWPYHVHSVCFRCDVLLTDILTFRSLSVCCVCCTVGYVCYNTLNKKQPNRSRCRLWLTKEPFAGWGPGLSQERGQFWGFCPIEKHGNFLQ